MGIHAPMAVGIPAGVTLANLEPDADSSCEWCETPVNPDRAVRIREMEFCSRRCAEEWIVDHADEVLRWLSD